MPAILNLLPIVPYAASGIPSLHLFVLISRARSLSVLRAFQKNLLDTQWRRGWEEEVGRTQERCRCGCGGGGRQSGRSPGRWNEESPVLFRTIKCGPREVELDMGEVRKTAS